jgi:hypothetical protein
VPVSVSVKGVANLEHRTEEVISVRASAENPGTSNHRLHRFHRSEEKRVWLGTGHEFTWRKMQTAKAVCPAPEIREICEIGV